MENQTEHSSFNNSVRISNSLYLQQITVMFRNCIATGKNGKPGFNKLELFFPHVLENLKKFNGIIIFKCYYDFENKVLLLLYTEASWKNIFPYFPSKYKKTASWAMPLKYSSIIRKKCIAIIRLMQICIIQQHNNHYFMLVSGATYNFP